MPIPGYKVSYPDHEELKKIYIELLQADGLEDGFESLKHSNEFYSLPGDYRSILVTPSEDPKVEFNTDNQILEDFSQDPEHVSLISEYNLFYEETDKLRGKPKLVGGNYENYRPRT